MSMAELFYGFSSGCYWEGTIENSLDRNQDHIFFFFLAGWSLNEAEQVNNTKFSKLLII